MHGKWEMIARQQMHQNHKLPLKTMITTTTNKTNKQTTKTMTKQKVNKTVIAK